MLDLCCGLRAQQLQLGALIALGKTRGQTASSVLEGEFSTTGPPRKFRIHLLLQANLNVV